MDAILEALSQQDSAVCKHKAEIPTLVHNKIADALSNNIAFKAAMEGVIAQSHDHIQRSVWQYTTDNVIPCVVQDTTNEVDAQSQALATSLREQRKHTASELLSICESVSAAAAENQNVLCTGNKLNRTHDQLRDNTVALAHELDKVKATKNGLRKSVDSLRDNCSTKTGRMVDCQQEIQTATQTIATDADSARSAVNASTADVARLLADVQQADNRVSNICE